MQARTISQPEINTRNDNFNDFYFKKKVCTNKHRGKERDKVHKLVPIEDVKDSESPSRFMNTVHEPTSRPAGLEELSDLDEPVQEWPFQDDPIVLQQRGGGQMLLRFLFLFRLLIILLTPTT